MCWVVYEDSRRSEDSVKTVVPHKLAARATQIHDPLVLVQHCFGTTTSLHVKMWSIKAFNADIQ
jgi:hypothetical protein